MQQAEIATLAFSPDGTQLAATIDAGELTVWDVATRTILYGPTSSLPTGDEEGAEAGASPSVVALRYLSDTRIATLAGRAIIEWNLTPAAALTVARLEVDRGTALVSDGEGRPLLLTASGAVWSPEPGLHDSARTGPEQTGSQLTALAWSAQGAVTGDQAGTVRVGTRVLGRLAGSVTAVSADRSGDVVAAATANGVSVFDGARVLQVSTADAGPVRVLTLSPNGGLLAAAAGSRATWEVMLWELPFEETPLQQLDTSAVKRPGLFVDALLLDDEGTMLVAGDDRMVSVNRTTDGRSSTVDVLTGHKDGVVSLALVGDDLWSSSQDGAVIHWVAAGEGGYRQVGDAVTVSRSVVRVAPGPPGRLLALAGWRRTGDLAGRPRRHAGPGLRRGRPHAHRG